MSRNKYGGHADCKTDKRGIICGTLCCEDAMTLTNRKEREGKVMQNVKCVKDG